MSEETRAGRTGEPVELLETGGWELAEESAETLFELSAVRVEGLTRVYEDAALGRAVREATGVDRLSRFFFATTLEFSPPLAPGVATMVRPTVASEARREFANDLAERGFRDVERGRTRSVRVGTGARARLTDYRAVYPLGPESAGDTGVDLRVRGFLAVWLDGEFRIAGGTYPESGLAGPLAESDVEPDGTAYREELLELIRATG